MGYIFEHKVLPIPKEQTLIIKRMNNTDCDGLIRQEDADLTSRQKEDQIKVSGFSMDPHSKYISTVSDTTFTLEDNLRYKYLACFISQKNQITGIKLQKYHKKGGSLVLEEPAFNIPVKQVEVLQNFLQFLLNANLAILSSGKFVLADNLDLESDLYSKLISLSKDEQGKLMLRKLFETGYLTADLDICQVPNF